MGRLCDEIAGSPPIYDAGKADADFRDLIKAAGEKPELAELLRLLNEASVVQALLKSIFSASPYLTGLILREPEGLQCLLQADTENFIPALAETLDEALEAATSANEAKSALRLFKRRVALGLALMDIGKIIPVDETVRSLSLAAGAALNGAVRYLLRQAAQKGDYFPADMSAPEKGSGYIILGLGKLGAFELNYSSDIDIIVFFERGVARLKEGLDPQQFFVRVTKDLVQLMQERTAEGYVFRTDLRLRPDPGATQVALSTEGGLIYYESFGQNWERAAMIKARPVAGDLAAGKHFLEELSPFVWRKYLDYAAIADVHAMKRQIHAVKGHGEIAVKGHNLKLGRGGIREIEFFAQTQQLIAGGRQPNLRLRGTLEALQALVRNDWIRAEAAEELTAAYRFLRHVEHRLQMIADEQTHSLPSDDENLLRVARFSGFEDLASFAQTLTAHLKIVQGHYGVLFEDVPELASDSGNLVFTGDDADPGTVETLTRLGFPNPLQVIETVKSWHFGRYPATRSARARERLTEVQPMLLEALGRTAQPEAALIAFDRFLAALPAGIQLFSLLRNNPSLLALIASIMGTAPRLASVLSRRANLLDAVLDPGFFGDLPSEEALKELVDEAMAESEHYQDCLDRARDIGQEQSFLIGVRILSGSVPTSRAGGALTHLAEQLVQAMQRTVERSLAEVHGVIPGSSAAVIAMGKLGGEEMTANSDLDLIVVYDFDPAQTESDGPKKLNVSQYYARFTQRLISALTAPTARGKLYEVDMRLRPSGNAGPVAASFESFETYQREKAWTWEHMALTRARVISGPDHLRERIENLIREVLSQERDAAMIAQDCVDMRQRLAEVKGDTGLWNLKHVSGGLMDAEFIAQYLQLIKALSDPRILSCNTLQAFRNLKEFGALGAGSADILISATGLYHDLTQILRLCYEGQFDPEEAPHGLKSLLAQAAGEQDFARLEIRLQETEAAVTGLFNQLLTLGMGE